MTAMPIFHTAHLRVRKDGRRTVNTEPLPGSLVTVTSPPIMRASSPKAGPAEALRGRCVSLGEFLEQLRLMLSRHADAGINHCELDPPPS
jgi:hypothetical protein